MGQKQPQSGPGCKWTLVWLGHISHQETSRLRLDDFRRCFDSLKCCFLNQEPKIQFLLVIVKGRYHSIPDVVHMVAVVLEPLCSTSSVCSAPLIKHCRWFLSSELTLFTLDIVIQLWAFVFDSPDSPDYLISIHYPQSGGWMVRGGTSCPHTGV